jgi:cobalt-precorrin-7 (C5)-methyltransferase
MEHKIIVVGIGPGSLAYLLPVAKQAIEGAKVLVGSRRALGTFAPEGRTTRVIDRDIDGVMEFIRKQLPGADVVVMVSGDPGFYSMLAVLRREFPPEKVEVIPGISSVQLAFARIANSWHDADLVSLHGREAAEADLAYRKYRKLGILTDGQHDPRYIAGLLITQGWPAGTKTWLCAELSYPNERILETTLEAAARTNGFEHCVMVVIQ